MAPGSCPTPEAERLAQVGLLDLLVADEAHAPHGRDVAELEDDADAAAREARRRDLRGPDQELRDRLHVVVDGLGRKGLALLRAHAQAQRLLRHPLAALEDDLLDHRLLDGALLDDARRASCLALLRRGGAGRELGTPPPAGRGEEGEEERGRDVQASFTCGRGRRTARSGAGSEEGELELPIGRCGSWR
jgi:hypothetical protein